MKTKSAYKPGYIKHHPIPRDVADVNENVTIKYLKVLIVEDNVDAAETLGEYVSALGHMVCIEHSPYKAIQRALEEPPDLCLLDINLPDMNGNELARELREKGGEKIVLAAVTGFSQEEDRIKALEAGFQHIFAKPVNTTRLVLLLNSMSMIRRP